MYCDRAIFLSISMYEPTWVYAMVEEYDSIVRNSAWEIVPRLVDKSVVGSIWIYKVKKAADGSVEKYKARFMASARTNHAYVFIRAAVAS